MQKNEIRKKLAHMEPKMREAFEMMYKEFCDGDLCESSGFDIIKLAIEMDDKGEWWKFKEVFSDGDEQYRFSTTD